MYNVYGLKWCVFCLRAVVLLQERGVKFYYCPMDEQSNVLRYMKETFNHKTVPIITHEKDGEETLIGGYDDLVEYFRQQEDKESDNSDS